MRAGIGLVSQATGYGIVQAAMALQLLSPQLVYDVRINASAPTTMRALADNEKRTRAMCDEHTGWTARKPPSAARALIKVCRGGSRFNLRKRVTGDTSHVCET